MGSGEIHPARSFFTTVSPHPEDFLIGRDKRQQHRYNAQQLMPIERRLSPIFLVMSKGNAPPLHHPLLDGQPKA